MGYWTDQGFVANTLSFYKSAIQQAFVDAFGEDFALDDTLPQGVLIQRLAELFYGMDMDGIEGFSHLNLNSMNGIFLDVVGNIRGIPRVLGTPQKGLVTVSCYPQNFTPFTIPQGTQLTVVETGDVFVTTSTNTFSTNIGSIEVEYVENGNSSSIPGNTMTVNGLQQIQNIVIISLVDGMENESDLEYRHRLQKEYPAAVGTIEYVNNLLRQEPTIKSVGCVYNDTDTTVGGIPPYCTEWLVAPTAEAKSSIVDNSIVVEQTVGDSLSDLEADIDTFETYVSPTRTMQLVFTYDGSDWLDIDSNVVTLSDYGVTYSGTPVLGDAIAVTFTVGAFGVNIANIIVDNKVPGSPTSGNTSVTVTDTFGSEKTVSFSVAEEVPIEIEISVGTPEETGFFDLVDVPESKQKVVDYVNSLDIGKDVSYSRCVAPFAADTGFDILGFKMRAKGSAVWVENGNLVITDRQYASLAITDITVGL